MAILSASNAGDFFQSLKMLVAREITEREKVKQKRLTLSKIKDETKKELPVIIKSMFMDLPRR